MAHDQALLRNIRNFRNSGYGRTKRDRSCVVSATEAAKVGAILVRASERSVDGLRGGSRAAGWLKTRETTGVRHPPDAS